VDSKNQPLFLTGFQDFICLTGLKTNDIINPDHPEKSCHPV
jgi:hypothetical protein